MIHLVTYKLTPDKDYTSFYNTLKAGPTLSWWHYLDNVWLIKTDESASKLMDRVRPTINEGKDRILIIKVDPSNYWGYLPSKAHDWIKRNNSR